MIPAAFDIFCVSVLCYLAEGYLEQGGQNDDVIGYTQEQLLADIVTQYEKYLHCLLHLSNAAPGHLLLALRALAKAGHIAPSDNSDYPWGKYQWLFLD